MRNIVSTFCLSALLAAPLSAAFTLTTVSPRIFSPNAGNNLVNRAWFHYTNPDSCEVTIRIFALNGSLVRRNLDYEAGIMYWNGKDQNGAMVKGGIYIYQIEAADKVLTGTVVVAK